MCTYIRLSNMPKIFDRLKQQTNKDFDFYISNNCDNKDNKLMLYFNKYGKDLGFNSYIKNYNNMYKIFSRFYLARDLANEGYEKIVFFDDDQMLPESFIQDCYDQYEETSIKSFYAHKFKDEYWNKIRLNKKEVGNYAGGGGLMCPAELFLNDNFFDCPKEYYILDDLWLSYYILKFTKYKIKLLDTDIQFIYDDKATFIGLEQMKSDFSKKYIVNNI